MDIIDNKLIERIKASLFMGVAFLCMNLVIAYIAPVSSIIHIIQRWASPVFLIDLFILDKLTSQYPFLIAHVPYFAIGLILGGFLNFHGIKKGILIRNAIVLYVFVSMILLCINGLIYGLIIGITGLLIFEELNY